MAREISSSSSDAARAAGCPGPGGFDSLMTSGQYLAGRHLHPHPFHYDSFAEIQSKRAESLREVCLRMRAGGGDGVTEGCL